MGIRDDLNYGLAAFGIRLPERLGLDDWAHQLTGRPTTNVISLVTGAAVLFYLAERGHNDKVRDIYDALMYCSTNISVGYCDIFAMTPTGKLIGSTLMTLGPAMSARALDGAGKTLRNESVQREMLQTMKAILARMESATPAPPDRPADAPPERS